MEYPMQALARTTEQRFQTNGIPAFALPASPDTLDLLEQFGAAVSVQRDREIHAQGDQANCCYRIVRGCVRVVKLMEDGRRQISEFLMAGDLLGFDALDTFDFAAEAVTDVVLRRQAGAVSLRGAHARLVLLGRKTASERIATFLVEMAERLPPVRPGVLDLPMSRTDVADHLGLTIETVCRVLAALRREGTISIERASVTIRDAAALHQMASEPRH
jgi:CRP/FNR family nitrogen fixation transcriptional regulator